MSLDEHVNAENKNTDVSSRYILLNNCAVLGDICKLYAKVPAVIGLYFLWMYFLSRMPAVYDWAEHSFSAAITSYSFGVVMKDGIYKNVSRWYEIQDKKNKDIQKLEEERNVFR